MDDFYLAPQSLLKAKIKKKNKNLGWETRHIALGLTQLIISRDPGFHKLLNVVPLTSGTFALKRKDDHLHLRTSEREFAFKFDDNSECEKWFMHMIQLTGFNLTDFVADTAKIREHQDMSPQMKQYLSVEKEIKRTLANLNKLKREKDSLEK